MIIKFLIIGWIILISMNIITIWKFSKSIKPLKDIVLNGFLEKYRHKFITYLQEAIIDIKHGDTNITYSGMDINKKDICKLALSKLKEDCIEDSEFSSEVESIKTLFGKKQIANLILYNFNTLASEGLPTSCDMLDLSVNNDDQSEYEFNPDDYDINESDIKEVKTKTVSEEELEALAKLSIPAQVRDQQYSEFSDAGKALYDKLVTGDVEVKPTQKNKEV